MTAKPVMWIKNFITNNFDIFFASLGCLLLLAFVTNTSSLKGAGFLKDGSAQVQQVDFAFDGGSLLIELRIDSELKYLLVVCPHSPIYKRFTPGQIKVMSSSNKDFSSSVAATVSHKDITNLVTALAKSSETKGNREIAAILLALNSGMEVKTWGGKATDSISDGNWLLLFSGEVEIDEGDPFD